MWWRKQVDTSQAIFALASGSLPSAVAIVRLSGGRTLEIANAICERKVPKQGRVLSVLRNSRKEKIDEALVLSFVCPNSFTGEDVVEFQCHGSKAIARELQKTLIELGARPAEAGEFSYRAHLNGKLNTTDLETLSSIYKADHSIELKALYDRLDGSMKRLVADFRKDLLRLQAVLDTAIDFSEEIEGVLTQAKAPLSKVIHECSLTIQRFEASKPGVLKPRLVLAGRPNAGKSSLFNALLNRYRTIVDQTPGTTRDVIEEEVLLAERPWLLVDTAGVRVSSQTIEQQGIELGAEYLEACNYWCLVVDGKEGIQEAERTLLKQFSHKPHVVVWNKRDLKIPPKDLAVLETSALNGEGVTALWKHLEADISKLPAYSAGPVPSESQRTRLSYVQQELGELEKLLEAKAAPEILSEKNRLVMGTLESLLGEVEMDDVLDRVFGDFCIGK